MHILHTRPIASSKLPAAREGAGQGILWETKEQYKGYAPSGRMQPRHELVPHMQRGVSMSKKQTPLG